ncbi:MAG TPA: hypothetical protein VEA63_03775, partial [Opitutus sp.]|nr:hypothetical protein [Opitutus sp.]
MKAVLERDCSFREAKQVLEREFVRSLDGASWKWAKEELAEISNAGLAINGKVTRKAGGEIAVWGGDCATCPKRTGNIEGCEGSPNVCTDLDCFGRKLAKAGEIRLREAEASGQRVITRKEWERVRYNRAYVEPEKEVYEVSWDKPIGEVLKKAKIEPPMVVVDSDQGVLEMVDVARAKDLLKDAGVLKTESRRMGESDKAARAKAVLEARVAEAKTTAIVEKVEKMGEPDLAMWRRLAHAAAMSCWHDSAREIAKRRGLAEKGKSPDDVLAKATETFTEAECFGFLTEVLVARGLRGEWHVREDAKAVQQELKLDLGAVEKRVKAELEAKRKEKESKSKAREATAKKK